MERDNPMAETSDGYRITTTTYGECRDEILRIVPTLKSRLADVKADSIVGLYMDNSLVWIQTFWAILASGYKPLLLNTRLSKSVLDKTVEEYDVKAVISEGKQFDTLNINISEVLASETENKAELEDLTFANEVIFMSSGTTDSVKLCSYRGKNFIYQLKDSAYLIKNCPAITGDYEGMVKQLAVLPLYHVFGFIAMYLWYSFFARTFVFLKDMRPKTILSTAKKHKVTHIFAVPLLWDGVYKEVLKNVRTKGEKAWKKFEKGIKIASTDFGRKVMRSAFSEIRSSLFGESIKLMISGGSHVSEEVLNFYNAIGYHMCNGYGMTEIGITSVELSDKIKTLTSTTIGKPLESVEYMINENGELCVRGKCIARKIRMGGVETVNDYDAWFNTKDLAEERDGRYFICGRRDDVVVCENGENINPLIVENLVSALAGVDGACLFAGVNEKPVLLVFSKNCMSKERAEELKGNIAKTLAVNNLSGQIKIEITTDPLMDKTDFKISRKKIAKRFADGGFFTLNADTCFAQALSQLEKDVSKHFATVLRKESEEISVSADFFTELGGSSLDYFELADIIRSEYGVSVPMENGMTVTTVQQMCEFISKNL